MPIQHFTPETFRFLSDLRVNNDREWFRANKDRYVEHVQEPAINFIIDFAPHLARLSPHLVADARIQGGSLFRINRDTRFSKDKTPYKTNTGVQFRHEAGKDVHAPGLYLHLEPGGCFGGIGLWRPEATVARRIRQAIVDDPTGWRKAAHGKRFSEVWKLEGDSLVRIPPGVDPEHPFLEDAKRKDYIASARLSEEQVTSPGFLREFSGMAGRARHFMAFLCGALDLPF